MSSLRGMVDQLRREALSSQHLVAFAAARAQQPALACHQDMASVLEALADEREDTYPQREALAQALLAEHRAGAGPLWTQALVAAFYPMLSRLRHRLVASSLSREDLDQLVLTAFLSALEQVPLNDRKARTALRLRQRTERLVFRTLRRERAEQQLAAAADELAADAAELGLLEPSVEEPPEEERETLPVLLAQLPDGALSARGREVLVATVLRRERLRDYVHRTVAGDEQTRERAYQRLKRQRTRALQRLRTLFSASPLAQASGF